MNRGNPPLALFNLTSERHTWFRIYGRENRGILDDAAPLGAPSLPNAYRGSHLSQRKKNQTSSPVRAKTISIATTKKMKSVAILLGNGSKKEAR